jgi:tetratricopeptide (TPR) repeat protein
MHRVMYEWLVHVLVRETDTDLLNLAVSAVGFSIPDVIRPKTPDEHAKLILHANAMLPRLVQKGYALPHVDFRLLSSEELNTASTLLDAEPQHLLMRGIEYPLRFPCNLFWMDGRQTVALDLLNKSIRYLQTQSGFENDPLSLVLMYTKHSKTMVTNLEEADNVLRNLLERFNSLNLPYWKIKTGNMLALLMKQQLKINEAVNYWQQLTAECRNLYGPFHELTSMVFYNMMGCLVITGVSKAKQHVEAIREDTEAMAPTQPRARELLRQLGLLYIDCGDFKEADQVLRKVLSLEIELNGRDSIEVGRSHAGLAHLGLRYPQEDSLFHGQEWRRIQEHVYDSTANRGTADSYIVLAELLCMNIFGRETEALSCFMRGSEIYGQLKDFERVEKIKGRMEYIQRRGRMEYMKRRSRGENIWVNKS